MNDFKLYLEENNISEQQLIDWMTYMNKYYYKEYVTKVIVQNIVLTESVSDG